jgi:PAS domain S-box-containing protein
MTNHYEKDSDSCNHFYRLHVRAYESIDSAAQNILRLVTNLCSMTAGYVSRISVAESQLEIVSAYHMPGGIELHAGERYPLPSTYCRITADPVDPKPLIIEDAATDPRFVHDPARPAFPEIDSYIGIPIVLPDETIYGTLCVLDRVPRSLSTHEVDFLLTFGRMLASHIAHDIELQRRNLVEEELRRSETRFHDFARLSPDMIATIVDEGDITFINPAGTLMLGAQSPDQILGHNVREFVSMPDLMRIRTAVQPGLPLADGHPQADILPKIETQLRTVTGEEITVELAGFMRSTNEQTRLKLIARDISKRKKDEQLLASAVCEQQTALEKLERVNTAKSRFISIVSHEFRTALTGIQGFSEMMRDEDFTIAEMREFAVDIHEDAKRLNRMITEMLDLDRMESGHMKLDIRPVDLDQLLHEVHSHAARGNTKHAFLLDAADSLPILSADRDKLIQVFTNLLSNAVKYSPNGGTITITGRRTAEGVRISVKDQGIGLSHAAIEHIFERYKRVDSGAGRFIAGTGLGLPISRQIVELHNGHIHVESTEGAGATFIVDLPVVVHAEAL